MSKSVTAIFVFLGVSLVITLQSLFIVPETQQIIVLRFGDPVRQHVEPGLKAKIPFFENLKIFDRRVLDVDPPPEEVILEDQKRLVVDTFARYKITNMLLFYKTLQTENQAVTRLHNLINSSVRSALGNVSLKDILTDKRSKIMADIKDEVNSSVQRFGIEIVDVRIGRADFPNQISQSIYARMRSERDREAKEFRAQGNEEARRIRSTADKESAILLSEAEKKAQIIKGEGDKEAIKIYADAYKKDPRFYAFYRSLEAYKAGLTGNDTTFVLSPKSEFFRFFEDATGNKKK